MHPDMRLFIIYVVLFIGCLISCTKDKLELVEFACIDEITYSNEVRPIIQNTCAYSGCHDGSGAAPGDFTSFDGIAPFLTPDRFENRSLILRDMPPNYASGPRSLTDDEIEMMNCWVENDYKE